jgi:putative glutamine amidotransferase
MKQLLCFLLASALLFSLSDAALCRDKKENQSQKPFIGISAKNASGVAATNLTYVNAIKKAGGVPIVIPMTTDTAQIDAILNIVSGVVMTGGEDIDPLKYFGEEPVRAQGEIVPERDTYDYLLVRRSVEKGLPLIGICRGVQILNVAFGGSLYQDIPSQVPGTFVKHSQDAPSSYGTHSITIDKTSLLYKILATDNAVVNSFHHQAVKEVAPGFKVVAKSKDGIVEGIEMIGNDKVFGVQFHPEGLVSKGDDTFLPIFGYFISKAVEYKERKR